MAAAVTALLVGLVLSAGACDAGPPTAGARGGVVEVVAAENFWGSIAAQVGGPHVHVTSIITDPNADPHAYEPTPSDARAMASAGLTVLNGVGYDPWASRLLAADDAGPGHVLDVGGLLGLRSGDNPHRWYDPTDVRRVVAALVADLSRLAPADAAAFRTSGAAFETVTLEPYDALLTRIRHRFAGTPVGASESIFALLAPALGLDLVTPPSFLKAISEGTDVSATDVSTIDAQIRHHRIRIYIDNSQNTTPDVAAQLALCRAAGIPTATITETLTPAGSTYQAWQIRQLQGILDALDRGTT